MRQSDTVNTPRSGYTRRPLRALPQFASSWFHPVPLPPLLLDLAATSYFTITDVKYGCGQCGAMVSAALSAHVCVRF